MLGVVGRWNLLYVDHESLHFKHESSEDGKEIMEFLLEVKPPFFHPYFGVSRREDVVKLFYHHIDPDKRPEDFKNFVNYVDSLEESHSILSIVQDNLELLSDDELSELHWTLKSALERRQKLRELEEEG